MLDVRAEALLRGLPLEQLVGEAPLRRGALLLELLAQGAVSLSLLEGKARELTELPLLRCQSLGEARVLRLAAATLAAELPLQARALLAELLQELALLLLAATQPGEVPAEFPLRLVKDLAGLPLLSLALLTLLEPILLLSLRAIAPRSSAARSHRDIDQGTPQAEIQNSCRNCHRGAPSTWPIVGEVIL